MTGGAQATGGNCYGHGSKRVQIDGETISEGRSSGDFDVIEETCTKSVINHTPLADVEGHAALKEYEARIHEAFPGFDVTFEDLLVVENRVAMRLMISGVHQDPMMEIEPTGAAVSFGNMIFHRMEDDLIAERWVQPDIFRLLVQLGAIDWPP